MKVNFRGPSVGESGISCVTRKKDKLERKSDRKLLDMWGARRPVRLLLPARDEREESASRHRSGVRVAAETPSHACLWRHTEPFITRPPKRTTITTNSRITPKFLTETAVSQTVFTEAKQTGSRSEIMLLLVLGTHNPFKQTSNCWLWKVGQGSVIGLVSHGSSVRIKCVLFRQ